MMVLIMTGEKTSKIPKEVRLNSIPKIIREKFGDEKALKMCRTVKYIKRKHTIECPNCKKKNTMRFRSTTRDYMCRNCKSVTPGPSRIVGYIVQPFQFKSDSDYDD